MNINTSVRTAAPAATRLTPSTAVPGETGPSDPQDSAVLAQDQNKPGPKMSLGTKAGMAVSAVGGAVVGYQYGGLIGGLVGLSAGSSVASDIAQANTTDITAVAAGAAGVGAMAIGGHLGGFLGLLIGAGCAAGVAKFVMQ